VDILQYRRVGVVLRPNKSRVAIVSESAGEVLIEYFHEMGWWCAGANNPVADVGPCDGLKIRHHQSGRDSLAAHVSTKDSDASSAEIEEIVEIAADRSRGQRSTRNSYPAQHRRYAW